MKGYILLSLWVFALSGLNAQSQYKIEFGYDSAGNQILRDRVCVNCQSAAKTPLDTTIVAEVAGKKDLLEDDISDEPENTNITAYPNPVTDVLTVEWATTKNKVGSILLHSATGQELGNNKIGPNQQNIELYFGRFPPGLYVVLVIYADGTKESFQVIKK